MDEVEITDDGDDHALVCAGSEALQQPASEEDVVIVSCSTDNGSQKTHEGCKGELVTFAVEPGKHGNKRPRRSDNQKHIASQLSDLGDARAELISHDLCCGGENSRRDGGGADESKGMDEKQGVSLPERPVLLELEHALCMAGTR